VDESDDTASSELARLKFILHIRALELPLLNCHNCFASGMEKMRTTVPFSEAVASIVPMELRDRCATGVLCACITLRADKEIVSKSSTSPVVGAGGGPGTLEVGVVGGGDGYARYDRSESDDNAQTAEVSVISLTHHSSWGPSQWYVTVSLWICRKCKSRTRGQRSIAFGSF
jgi:hypothetical protein